MVIFDYWIIFQRMIAQCMRPGHFILRKQWIAYTRFLEMEFFPLLLHRNIECIDFEITPHEIRPLLKSQTIGRSVHFPDSHDIARHFHDMGLRKLRFETRLESNQVSDVLNLFCHIAPDIKRKERGQRIIRKDIWDPLHAQEGLKRYCAQIRLEQNDTLIDIRYSYCQLTFSKVVSHLKKFGKVFKDHRWFFYAAPRFSLVLTIGFIVIPLLFQYILPGFKMPAIIVIALLIGTLTYILFQTVGSIEYDKEEQAQQ
ncbi:MAG: hypothetical protein Q8Q33_06215, partial [Chlamydiota bacterium]|nr:hypothetical protein [Chlamydiota bacterium]